MVARKSSSGLWERKIELEFPVSHDIRRVTQDTGETLMAKLLVPYLFRWQDVEAKSDLERLRLVVDHLPDEALMEKLGSGRLSYSSGVEFGISGGCVSARQCGIITEGAFAKWGAPRAVWF
jgi:hypothetical protein